MRNNNSKVFEFQMQIFVNICKVTIHTSEIMTRFLERDGIKCVLQKIYRRFGLQSVTPRITDRIMHSRLYSYEVPKRASRARFTKKKLFANLVGILPEGPVRGLIWGASQSRSCVDSFEDKSNLTTRRHSERKSALEYWYERYCIFGRERRHGPRKTAKNIKFLAFTGATISGM